MTSETTDKEGWSRRTGAIGGFGAVAAGFFAAGAGVSEALPFPPSSAFGGATELVLALSTGGAGGR